MIKSIGLALILAGILSGPAPAQERFRRTAPPPDPLPVLRLPSAEPVALNNGLKVSVAYMPNSPLVSARLIVFGGEMLAPASVPGTAQFAADMIGRATETLTPIELDEAVEGLGGSLSVTALPDAIVVSLTVLEESLDQALEILGQMVARPRFHENGMITVKTLATLDLQARDQDPEWAAKRHLRRVLFAGHPYERAAYSRESVKNWNLKDLRAYYARVFKPGNSHLVLGGNLTVNLAVRRAVRYFRDWPQGEAPEVVPQPPRIREQPRLCLVDIPRAGDCVVTVGAAFPPLGPDERTALIVLNQALGGGANSRLFLRLRESRELAYYAFSETEFLRQGGELRAWAMAPPALIVPVIQELLSELRRPVNEPLSEIELRQAKSALAGAFPRILEAPERFVEHASGIRLLGWGEEAWSGYYEALAAVDAERILRVAQEILGPPPAIVVAGDRAALLPRLTGLGSVEVYDNKGLYIQTIAK